MPCFQTNKNLIIPVSVAVYFPVLPILELISPS